MSPELAELFDCVALLHATDALDSRAMGEIMGPLDRDELLALLLRMTWLYRQHLRRAGTADYHLERLRAHCCWHAGWRPEGGTPVTRRGAHDPGGWGVGSRSA